MWILILVGSGIAWAASGELWAFISAASAGVALTTWSEAGKLRLELAALRGRSEVTMRGTEQHLSALDARIRVLENARATAPGPSQEPSEPDIARAAYAASLTVPTEVPQSTPEAEAPPAAPSQPWAGPTAVATVLTPAEAPPTTDFGPVSAAAVSRGPSMRPPAAPEPGFANFERSPDFKAKLRVFFIGDNPVARAGIFILLVGVALLLRLAAEHHMFPIEARLACLALFSVGLVGFGYRQRHERVTFARLLQGAGIAALYMVVFFAYRRFQLLPATLTFVLLLTVVLSSGVLAVLQDALALVFVDTVGGFAAPILASSGSGNHVALFSYYLILNALVLGVAWFKDWRLLNLTGFIATFGIGTTWGVLKYQPANFASTEPFLVAFFAIYLAITFLTALRRPASLRDNLSSALLFGLPLVSMGLQTKLAGDRDWIVAVSAIAAGAIYYGLARTLAKRDLETFRTLVDGYLALAVGLGTLAVPYAIDSDAMVSATWTLEAAGLYWVGVRSLRLRARVASVLVLFAGFGAALNSEVWTRPDAGPLPLLNPSFLCASLMFAAVLFIAALSKRHQKKLADNESIFTQLLIPLGFALFASAIGIEVHERVPSDLRPQIWLSCFAVAATALTVFGRKRSLTVARFTGLSLWPVAIILLGISRERNLTLWAQAGFVSWPLAVASIAAILHQQGEQPRPLVRLAQGATPLLLATLVLMLASDLVLVGAHLNRTWAEAALCVTAVLFALQLMQRRGLKSSPFSEFAPEHRLASHLLVAFTTIYWTSTLANAGTPTPLPYVPLLNPLDLASVGLVLFLRHYWHALAKDLSAEGPADLEGGPQLALVAMVFVIINVVLARSIHHFGHVPYDPDALWNSDAFQVSISILWSVLGVGGTLWGSRKLSRSTWMAAGALLCVVVLKIFLVDLDNLGQVARIMSFLGVGVLLLVVGYLAPLPPKRSDDQAREETAES